MRSGEGDIVKAFSKRAKSLLIYHHGNCIIVIFHCNLVVMNS